MTQQLNEFDSFIPSTNSKSVSFFTGTGRTIKSPALVILSLDNTSIKESENFLAIIIKSRTLDNALSDLWQKSHSFGVEKSEMKADYDALSNIRSSLYSGGDKLLSIIDNIRNNKSPFFTTKEIKTKGSLYKFMTTDMKMGNAFYKQVFGEIPSHDTMDSSYTKVGDAKLLFPDGIRESNKEALINLIKEVKSKLDDKGLGNLVSGIIHFMNFTGNRIGDYNLVDGQLRIHPNVKKSNDTIFTIVHELGHKLYHEVISDKIPQIKEDYLLQMKNYKPKSPDMNAIRGDLDFLKKLHVGMVVTYSGRKKNFKDIGNFKIAKISGGQVELSTTEKSSIYPEGRERIVAGGNYIFLKNPDWHVAGVEVEKIEPTTEYKESDSWFPTKYSQTNASEWFAELFSFYILGKLQGEPEAWMKNILKK